MHHIPQFTPVDIIFLTMIVASFVVFGITLMIVSASVALDQRKQRPPPVAQREVTPASWDKVASPRHDEKVGSS